jgi:hypothetical protein
MYRNLVNCGEQVGNLFYKKNEKPAEGAASPPAAEQENVPQFGKLRGTS